jgi:hypothetical protein
MNQNQRTAEFEVHPFFDRLEGLFAIFDKPMPSENVARMWFAMMGRYDMAQIDRAFTQHVATAKNGFPMPSDILRFLPKDPSEWPVASVALSEMKSIEGGRDAFVTAQHVGAYESARALFDSRDAFHGGRAFEAKYEELVIVEQNAGRKALWFLSCGAGDYDGLYRQEAIEEAKRIGRISNDAAVKLLGTTAVARLILTDEMGKANISVRCAEVLASLGRKSRPSTGIDSGIADTRARQAEADYRVTEYMVKEAAESRVRTIARGDMNAARRKTDGLG